MESQKCYGYRDGAKLPLQARLNIAVNLSAIVSREQHDRLGSQRKEARHSRDDPAIAGGVMGCAWKRHLWQGNSGVGIVVNGQTLRPRFRITFLVHQGSELRRRQPALIRNARSNHSQVSVAESSQESHSVELRQRAARVRKDGTDML